VGLTDQGAQVGTPLEQAIDFAHQRPGPGHVAEGEVHPGELDPSLHSQMGERVGQQVPQSLRANEFPPRGCRIPPMHKQAGLHRADEGVLDLGPTRHLACLTGQGLGLAPFTAGHRQQRLFAQRDGEDIGRADVAHGDGILEERFAAVKIAGQDLRDPLYDPDHRNHGARGRQLRRGLIGVGAHLLDPAAAQQGPVQSGYRLDERVIRSSRALVLPAIDHISPPLGLGRPPHCRGEKAGVHGGQRVSLDPALVL
jgi:hypothetical protein